MLQTKVNSKNVRLQGVTPRKPTVLKKVNSKNVHLQTLYHKNYLKLSLKFTVFIAHSQY